MSTSGERLLYCVIINQVLEDLVDRRRAGTGRAPDQRQTNHGCELRHALVTAPDAKGLKPMQVKLHDGETVTCERVVRMVADKLETQR